MQAGDIVANDGSSGDSIFGSPFDDECFVLRHCGPGTLSYCNRGPGTNESQFFIAMRAMPELDGKHEVIGSVIEGMDVLWRVNRMGSEFGEPSRKVVIEASGQFDPRKNQDEED